MTLKDELPVLPEFSDDVDPEKLEEMIEEYKEESEKAKKIKKSITKRSGGSRKRRKGKSVYENLSVEAKDTILEWLVLPEGEKSSRRKMLRSVGLTDDIYQELLLDNRFIADFEKYLEVVAVESRAKVFAKHLEQAQKGDTNAIKLFYEKVEGWDKRNQSKKMDEIRVKIDVLGFSTEEELAYSVDVMERHQGIEKQEDE